MGRCHEIKQKEKNYIFFLFLTGYNGSINITEEVKKMIKKWAALVLAGCMLVSAAGCAAADKKQPAADTEVASAAAQQRESWSEPYQETVTLTVARQSVAYEFPEGDDITNNIWTRSFREKMNVEVVTDWVSDEYETKLNLAIASGDLPDVFVVNDVQLRQLTEAGLVADLTEVYDKWASDTLKSFMEAEPTIFDTAKGEDGRLYAIPQLYSGYHPDLLWLRNDWMEQLGMEAPETVADLEEILRGMKEISGGYSYAVGQDLELLYKLGIAWGAYPGFWIQEEDGRIINGSTAPEMKEALKAFSQWYQEGLIKSDFATMNFDSVKEDIVAGKAGAQTSRSSWGWVYGVDTVKNLGTDAYFMPCDIPTVSGEKAVYPINFSNKGYIVVNKDCKNPEAVLSLIDYYVYVLNDAYTDGSMTAEEIEKYTANNMQHVTAPFAVTNSMDDYGRYDMIARAFETGDESVLETSIAVECYNGAKRWIDEKDPASVGYALQFGVKGCGMEKASEILKEKRTINSRLWGASPQALLDYGTTLDDILLEGFTKIIMGAEDVDYFDTLVEQWYAAGGQSVTDAVNEMYNK